MEIIKNLYRKYPARCILTLLLLFFCTFIMNDSFLYKTPVAKVVKTSIVKEEKVSNYNDTSVAITETEYEQKVTLKLLNTEHRGEKFTVTNTYISSQTDSNKLSYGDRLFVTIQENNNNISGSINGIKRDSFAFILIAIFIYILLIMTNKRGFFISTTLLINICIFGAALHFYSKGADILVLAYILVILFPTLTLVLSNGFNKNTLAAVISSFIALALSYTVMEISIKYGGEIDYSALDYIVGDHALDKIFFSGILLAGLGVIMDVTVTICSSLHELTIKHPKITSKELIKSGREIGFDIMGTMINVLLFTYICGLMPLIIIKMKNGISLLSILKLQIPFEICSFLMGSIEILLSIPVSIAVSSLLFNKRSKA